MKTTIIKTVLSILLIFSFLIGIISPGASPVFAANNDLSNPFGTCECVNLAFDASPTVIKKLIKWTKGTRFDNFAAPLSWVSWNAGNWGSNIRQYGPKMDATLDWENSVNNSPEVGAIVEYPQSSTTTSSKVINGETKIFTYTFSNNGHVSVVTAYNPFTNTISTSDKNWGECGPVQRENVKVTSSMIFIHEPTPLQKSTVLSNVHFSKQIIDSEFYSRMPLRNIWVKTASQFELWIDGKLIMSADRPQSWRIFSKQSVSITPFKTHTVNLIWWNSGGDPEPQFDQTWWPNTFVGAAELDPEAILPINYTYMLNPNPVLRGNPFSITASASTNSPFTISSIDIFAGLNKIGTISGSSGTVSISTQDFNTGNIQIRIIANIQDWQGSVSEAQTELSIISRQSTVPEIPSSQNSCSITSFNISPSSPQSIGASIHITGQAQCSLVQVRAMRLQIDGQQFSEIGSATLDTYWNTSNYFPGGHKLELQVAGIGDNDWTNIGSLTKSFELTTSTITQPTTPSTESICTITSVNISPSSPQSVGTSIHISATGICGNVPVRAMRILVDDKSINEIGAPSIETNWNTNSYDEGNHRIEIQVAAVGDLDWSNPGVRSSTYNLTAVPAPTLAPTVSLCQPPTLASPSIGSVMAQSTDVSLSWNTSTDATQYKVEVWGGPYSTMTPCDWQSGTSCHIGQMWPGTMSWHVKARNSSGQESNWSDTWTFSVLNIPSPTQTSAPSWKPTLSSPGNGSSWQQQTVIDLSWNSLSGASQYKVEVWGGPYSTMTPCDWQSGTSCHIGQMWPGTMSWRVKARTSSGQESEWSDTWTFTIYN